MRIAGDSLRAFRVAFGLVMAAAIVRFAAHGWIERELVAPRLFFPYPGLEWIRPWPAPLWYLHFAVMGGAALLIAAGRYYRAATLTFSALFTWAHLIDRTYYLNHYYLISALSFLMAWLPLDERALAAGAPRWALWAVRAQVGVVYVFGGIAKLQGDWLLRAEPLATWLSRNQDLPVVGPYFDRPALAYAMSWGGAAFDLSVVPLLCWRPTRPWAFAALLAFHLSTARLFPIGVFPWLMMALAPVFFAPDWPRRAWAWLVGRAPAPAVALALAPSARWVPAAVALWIALQVLVPLRAFLYPGNPLWTEEGFRFAWRVMVMEKNGAARFVVRDPDDGRQWRVLPATRLTPLQAQMMSTQPDMILTFAHHLDSEFRARGVRDPEVRAEVLVSLNGRPAAPLVDPTVDLSREREGLGPRHWVLPLPEGALAENTHP